MKTKQMLIKSLLVALVFTLFIAGIPMKSASANEGNLTEKQALEIVEALDNSAVKKLDGTTLINEDQLEKELKGNPDYLEIKRELKNMGLLTSELSDKSTPTVRNMALMMAAASSSQINPKWKAVRDACAKKYVKEKYGLAATGAVIAAFLEGNVKKALKFLLSRGANLTLAGLLTSYGHMNYKCIKLANSKHKVYK